MRDHDYDMSQAFEDGQRGRRGGHGGKGGARRRRGGFGGPDGMGSGPGGHGRGRGGRRGPGGRSRGDVRAAILVLLAEQPRHGYDLIRAIEERSSGAWTPSPGSVYPTLQALEDEGLITVDTIDGRKTASLTEAGTSWVEEHGDEHAAVFEATAAAEAAGALRSEIIALKEAAIHVARTPGADLTPQAVEILSDARKRLYRLLADQG